MSLPRTYEDLLKPKSKGGVGVAATAAMYEFQPITIKLFVGEEPLNIDTLLTKFCLLMGTSGSGKSNAAGLIFEQLLDNHCPLFIADMAGEHGGVVDMFKDQFIVVELNSLGNLQESALALAKEFFDAGQKDYMDRKSIYFDLSDVPRKVYTEFFDYFLWEFFYMKKKVDFDERVPHIFIFEEAHNFIPHPNSIPSEDYKNPHAARVKEIVQKFALEARKFGCRCIIISLRPALLDTTTISQAGLRFLLPVSDKNDVQVYSTLIPGSVRGELVQQMHLMKVGECFMVIPRVKVRRMRFRLKRSKDQAGTPSMASLLGFREGRSVNKNDKT